MIKVPFFNKKNSLTFANFICLLFLIFVPLVSLAQDVLPDLIVVKLPADIAHSSPVSNNIDNCSINKIARVNGGLVLENLTPDFLSARDPSISFDGQIIFFVGKRSAASFYQVYRMNIELPRIKPIKMLIPHPFPRPKRHEFDGFHHWMIGRTGFPLKKIKSDIISNGFRIAATYRIFEFYGHRFFVLEKL